MAGLVQAAVDAGDGGQVDHHVVARALPRVHKHQDERPVLRRLIPQNPLADDGVEQGRDPD